ncbi:hypothetical protein Nos7524_1209 [Nostoc sp. PCC 7524]|uniref:site-specific integrase n=1 Tax=Nostoc sp. (strain ATCC 29411 / PCC 7524) TaxID=28072 RepID=UPI00029ECA11|nr:site-specific integrase [Nostoc sp. PCC 7524]AFY47098.1 hypothetical protein Nos7524_1209 [Nostoc sp. PCC 7524]
MPKTRLHRVYNASTVDTEPKATTDGSYMGTMKHVQKQTAKSEEQLKLKLEEANARLKADKARVSIVRTGDALQLQATLPLKPGDTSRTGKEAKQYKLSLGIPANLNGLKTAIEEANELSKLIARKTFEWDDKYLGKKQDKFDKTFGELLDRYEETYFCNREKNIRSENTFKNYMTVLKRFDRQMLATPENIKEQFDKFPNEKPSMKHRVSITLNSFCAAFGINLKLQYKKPQTKRRSIPSNSDIESKFLDWEKYATGRRNKREEQADNWKVFRWIYGMLATYGCRPEEIIYLPDFKHWLSPNNLKWKVHEDCKTSNREALPLHKEWIELFDLKNPETVTLVDKYINGRCDLRGKSTLIQSISDWFKKVNVGFKPYDLRHAWAIRAHLAGIPTRAAAASMGHTLAVHMQIYQKWFDQQHVEQAFSQAVNKRDELEELKEENTILKDEITRLQSELERAKLILAEHQIQQVLIN